MREKEVKSVLNKTRKRDPWFLDDYTINPYSGCSFNCRFCYIRGSKYGIHMERRTTLKSNVETILRKELAMRARKKQYGYVVLSSATDPYLHLEEEHQLTKTILEILLEFRFPVHIITRSKLVMRDLNLLKKINDKAIIPPDLAAKTGHGVFLTFSFSTIDTKVASVFEPGASSPDERLETMQLFSKEGLKTGAALMPLIPFISDTETETKKAFEKLKTFGAQYIMPASITLQGNDPADNKTLMLQSIDKHYPALLDSYEKLLSGTNLALYRSQITPRLNKLNHQFGVPDRIIAKTS